MKSIWQSIILALLVSNAYSDEPFEFKGVPLGSTEQNLLEKHPEFKCKDENSFLGDRVCIMLKSNNATYAGVPANISLSFYSNRLERITVFFDSKSFNTVKNTLIKKYGQPPIVKTDPVSNRMGAQFLNEIAAWNKGEDILKVEKFSGDLTTSDVSIFSDRYDKESQSRKALQVDKNMGDI